MFLKEKWTSFVFTFCVLHFIGYLEEKFLNLGVLKDLTMDDWSKKIYRIKNFDGLGCEYILSTWLCPGGSGSTIEL